MLLAKEPEVIQDAAETVTTWKDKIWNWFTDMDMWMNVLYAGIKIIIIFTLTRLFVHIVFRLIDRSLQKREKSRLQMNPRRLVTVGELLKNVTTITSNFIMVMLVMGELGFDLAPLLAGAGVLGLAIGFGAQSLVKDVITGFFIILEDQFAVGDVIQTGSLKGTVEMIGLRSTRLVSYTGEVHIIPNGMITNVTNYSVGTALAVVDLPFSNSRKLEDSVELLRRAMQRLKEEKEGIPQVPNVLGIQSLTASEYVIRIAVECPPAIRSEVERQIHAYAKEALEQEELENQRGHAEI
ncbi:mechanosensitive ion channel family protein [Paenibacillus phoenicis]|uniref:Mechanosensitive ion channel family protein n=1 Tax=Paenibacillus phoenicis TaxID=554117 RepID=A0ABU5PQ87_9BACL|nr:MULTISPECIES: mechanosensitive ion channel family protein [Paenibacillus]EES74356.1 transporter, small conductance mechanosensitive ion channel MscS family protein [Paenibacillus sp. oral taxon 786 str. D14]MEA3571789.1 mechanosensitive ion channel family protein [Paenibacillus phoenicis]